MDKHYIVYLSVRCKTCGNMSLVRSNTRLVFISTACISSGRARVIPLQIYPFCASSHKGQYSSCYTGFWYSRSDPCGFRIAGDISSTLGHLCSYFIVRSELQTSSFHSLVVAFELFLHEIREFIFCSVAIFGRVVRA